jgi:hypothetical protein
MPYSTGTQGARQGKMRLSLAVGRPGNQSVTREALFSGEKAENSETDEEAAASIKGAQSLPF